MKTLASPEAPREVKMSPILVSFVIVMVVAIIVWWMMERVSDRITEQAFTHRPRDGPRFSPRRVGKLLMAFFAVGILGAIPGAVIQLWVASQEADKPDPKQEKINRTMQDAREAVRQGKAGKAFQQMFPEEHQEYLRKKKAAERSAAGKLDTGDRRPAQVEADP
ncbi:hypothetical protein AYO44_13835 [Planctomycetaceae bacterium SCGC AG-212-F19]|nr:hypothetical protein AYO44_13835 [Planctomycetaceae bacterium SCGC AG-212-F19]